MNLSNTVPPRPRRSTGPRAGPRLGPSRSHASRSRGPRSRRRRRAPRLTSRHGPPRRRLGVGQFRGDQAMRARCIRPEGGNSRRARIVPPPPPLYRARFPPARTHAIAVTDTARTAPHSLCARPIHPRAFPLAASRAVRPDRSVLHASARGVRTPLVRPNPYATRAIPSSVRANPLSPSPRLRRAPARSHPRAPRGALTRQTRRRPSPPIRTGAPKEHVPARTGVDSTPGHAKEAPRRRPRARARAPHTLA